MWTTTTPPPKRKRDALRELVDEQQRSALLEVKKEKGEALEDAAEAEETLGYQVRTTNCLQGKIDELVALCGEAERLSVSPGGGGRGRLRRGRPPRGRGARRGRLAQGQQHQVPDEPVGGWGFVSFKKTYRLQLRAR